jgi:D-alanine-D-alanine ligase
MFPRLHEADESLLAALDGESLDIVVIALHGAVEEDGSLRRVLELIGVPYLGTKAEAARSAWDKAEAKATLRRRGIPTPDWATLPYKTLRELGMGSVAQRVVTSLGLPLIVKPVQGGSGLGTQVVLAGDEISGALEHSSATVTRCTRCLSSATFHG